MNVKKITIISLAFLCAAAALFFVWKWVKPYDLPKVDQNKSINQYSLDFTKELEVLEGSDTVDPQGGLLPLDGITAENAYVAYRYASELMEGTEEEQELAIKYLLKAIEFQPDQLIYSNYLRRSMVNISRLDEFISLITDFDQRSSALDLQLALAYVDELQNPDIGIAVLGQTSAKSIEILSEIIERDPDYWLAYYARGLNNLYWPSGLLRTDKAVQDLGYCLAVAQHFEEQGVTLPLWPLTYEAYGDALVKNGEIEAGQKIWKEGSKKYPDAESLRNRAGSSKEEAYEIVRSERGIEIFERPDPNISDLSSLWTTND